MQDPDFAPGMPFPEFAAALWKWLLVACPHIGNIGGHKRVCDNFFIQAESNLFRRVCRDRTIYDPGAVVASLNLPQFSDVDVALREDPRLREIRGRAVGGGVNLVPIEATRLAMSVIPSDDKFEEPRDLKVAESTKIDQLCRRLDAFLTADSFEVEFVTPLWGLRIEDVIQIESDAFLEPLNDGDVERALRLQVISGDHWNRSFHRDEFHNLCFRRLVKLPKAIVGRLPSPEEVASLPDQPDAFAFTEVDRLLTMFPLISSGNVRAGATMRSSRIGFPWSIEGATYGPWAVHALDDHPYFRPNVSLNRQDGEYLSKLWQGYMVSPERARMDLALRRLRNASERSRDDDRILDLMIAAEALFIPRGSGHDELRFRVSLHGAFSLESDMTERKRVYKILAGGYDFRSKVAHGDDPGSVRVGGESFDIHRLLPELESIIRKALQLRMESPTVEVDWLSLVAGSKKC